jgi:hypothetical protein
VSEGDDPFAGGGLEIFGPGAAALDGELLGDVEFVAVEVQVGPAEAEELAATQAGDQREVERRAEPVLRGGPQEPAGNFECPTGSPVASACSDSSMPAACASSPCAPGPRLVRHIEGIDPKTWKTVSLDRDGHYRKPQVVDEEVTLSAYPGAVRQLLVRGLGHAPTVIITNDRRSSMKQIIERYARRMTIEQRLAESIRSFHLDALASAVPLNVDLDVVLSVLAGAVCAGLRRRLGTDYTAATPDTLQRRFLSTGGVILNHDNTIVVRLNPRTYSPVVRSAETQETPVPWWGGRRLRFEYA